jgi:2-(1,2-epoxy-1,2-dihydrophenyl)acetyl-CoA isomerase
MLSIEISEAIATLTLDSPSVCNAIDYNMIRALAAALDDIQHVSRGVRTVVITGGGDTFCAGADLRYFESLHQRARRRAFYSLRNLITSTIARLCEFRIPIVAAVNGPAVGLGMSLALASDILVASDIAYFAPSFTRLGCTPDGGITSNLPRRIGLGRSLSCLLLADTIDAQTAHAWGLAYTVVPAHQLAPTARSVALKLAGGSRLVLEHIRRLNLSATDSALSKQLCKERFAQREALASLDYVEGIQAFFDKRGPRF